MKELFVVTRRRGTAWDASKPLDSQEQWTEHAAFMNGLARDGFIVLGGPVGDGSDTLLIVDAPIRMRSLPRYRATRGVARGCSS